MAWAGVFPFGRVSDGRPPPSTPASKATAFVLRCASSTARTRRPQRVGPDQLLTKCSQNVDVTTVTARQAQHPETRNSSSAGILRHRATPAITALCDLNLSGRKAVRVRIPPRARDIRWDCVFEALRRQSRRYRKAQDIARRRTSQGAGPAAPFEQIARSGRDKSRTLSPRRRRGMLLPPPAEHSLRRQPRVDKG